MTFINLFVYHKMKMAYVLTKQGSFWGYEISNLKALNYVSTYLYVAIFELKNQAFSHEKHSPGQDLVRLKGLWHRLTKFSYFYQQILYKLSLIGKKIH